MQTEDGRYQHVYLDLDLGGTGDLSKVTSKRLNSYSSKFENGLYLTHQSLFTWLSTYTIYFLYIVQSHPVLAEQPAMNDEVLS